MPVTPAFEQRTDKDVHRLHQAHDVVPQRRATCDGDNLKPSDVLAELLKHGRRLQCELARRDEHQSLDALLLRIDLLEARDAEGARFTRPVFGSREDVASGEGEGDGLFLDG